MSSDFVAKEPTLLVMSREVAEQLTIFRAEAKPSWSHWKTIATWKHLWWRRRRRRRRWYWNSLPHSLISFGHFCCLSLLSMLVLEYKWCIRKYLDFFFLHLCGSIAVTSYGKRLRWQISNIDHWRQCKPYYFHASLTVFRNGEEIQTTTSSSLSSSSSSLTS